MTTRKHKSSRPKGRKKPESSVTTVRLDADLLEEIAEEADRDHSSVSRMIRVLLMDALAARKERNRLLQENTKKPR